MEQHAAIAGKKGYRRRWRNFLLQPLVQIKLGLYSILVAFFFSLLMCAVAYLGLKDVLDVLLELTDQPSGVEELASPYVIRTLAMIALLGVGFCVTQLLVAVLYTHRLVGPIVAVEHALRRLIAGNYSATVRLRKKDAFGNIAGLINELTTQLDRDRKSAGGG